MAQFATNAPQFIGIEAIQHIADQYESQLIMGASYFRPEEFDRLGIGILTGLQFKRTNNLLVRKGGTTRRKEVGTPIENKIGFIKERVLVARLTWNRFKDNRDNYVETPIAVEGSAEFSYPLSEAAFLAITATYGEDLYANLWFGDITNGAPGMDLFDGYHTCIAKDINDGYIGVSQGNYKEVPVIDAPDDAEDCSAWQITEDFILSWNGMLKNQPKVLLYCSSKTGVAIQAAYANKWRSHKSVNMLANGNFTVSEYPRIEFVPDDNYGEGDRLIATIPGNLQYGVNSLDSRSKIVVREGSDNDTEDITFQVQSIQGARLLSPLASVFCMTNGTISSRTVTGDYTKSECSVVSEDTTKGTVTVSPAADAKGEYVIGTTVTMTATAAQGYAFKKWSDGVTTNPRTHVTTGMNESFIAKFEATE